jgi:hypothetical protein
MPLHDVVIQHKVLAADKTKPLPSKEEPVVTFSSQAALAGVSFAPEELMKLGGKDLDENIAIAKKMIEESPKSGPGTFDDSNVWRTINSN